MSGSGEPILLGSADLETYRVQILKTHRDKCRSAQAELTGSQGVERGCRQCRGVGMVPRGRGGREYFQPGCRGRLPGGGDV